VNERPPPGHLSVKEASARLGIAHQRAYQIIALGLLPSTRRSGRLWVPERAVDQRIADQARQQHRCLGTVEVARRFGVTVKTVLTWRDRGLLTSTKIQNKLCFSPEEVEKFVRPSEQRSRRARGG
jgi:predicted site-specific integrase-resolvase